MKIIYETLGLFTSVCTVTLLAGSLSSPGFSEEVNYKLNPDVKESKSKAPNGFVISRIREGSALFKAGVRNGDRVLRIGEVQMDSFESLSNKVKNLSLGDKPVDILVLRDGREIILKVDPVR